MDDIQRKYGLRHIIDPLFRLNFFYCNDSTQEQYQAKFLKLNGVPTSFESCGGRFEGIWQAAMGIERGMIWVPNDELDVLSHEVFHAARWALYDRRNIEMSNENEETYAYYIQYLTKECLSKGYDARITIRKDLPAPKATPRRRKKTKA
jgi:hypothetical protein